MLGLTGKEKDSLHSLAPGWGMIPVSAKSEPYMHKFILNVLQIQENIIFCSFNAILLTTRIPGITFQARAPILHYLDCNSNKMASKKMMELIFQIFSLMYLIVNGAKFEMQHIQYKRGGEEPQKRFFVKCFFLYNS